MLVIIIDNPNALVVSIFMFILFMYNSSWYMGRYIIFPSDRRRVIKNLFMLLIYL